MKVVHSRFLVVIFLDKIDLLKVVNCLFFTAHCQLHFTQPVEMTSKGSPWLP